MGSMGRSLEIRHCRALVAVADAGGVAGAARSLGWAQSSVSETCLSLERVLGAQVIVRRHGLEARLAPEGLRFLPQARALVAAAEAAEESFRSGRGTRLELGAIESISTYLLPPALVTACDRRPESTADVTIGMCEDLRRMVSAATLDMCLTLEGEMPAPEANCVAREMGEVSLVLFGSEGTPIGRVAPSSLEGSELLVPDPAGSLTAHLSAWLTATGVKCRIRSAGSVEGVRRGVRLGTPIGVLPAYAMLEQSDGDPVRSLELTTPPRPMLLIATIGVHVGNRDDCERLVERISAGLGDRRPVSDTQ